VSGVPAARRGGLVAVGTRPEAVEMAPVVHAPRAEPWGEVRFLSTAHPDRVRIVAAASRPLDDRAAYAAVAQVRHPPGGGPSARRIARVLRAR